VKGVKEMRKSGIIRILMVMAAAMILSIAGQTYAWEDNTDRPGMDYKNFNLTASDPALCENACKGDATCKAWTYVKPNTIQGPQARCWLKNSVPAAKANQCCISGVKQLTMQAKPLDPVVIDRIQIQPGQLQKTCPDIKAMSIDFKLVSKTSNYCGIVEMIGTAKNIGTANNPVGGKLLLFRGNEVRAETSFGTVPKNGGMVTVYYKTNECKWTQHTGDFILKVVYNPYSGIPNKYDVDCDWSNNEIKRPIADAGSVF
jgi:hypothetical protein